MVLLHCAVKSSYVRWICSLQSQTALVADVRLGWRIWQAHVTGAGAKEVQQVDAAA